MKTGIFFLLFGFSAALIVACSKAESSTNKSETQTELPIKKTKEAYTKAIIGTWRIDTDSMEKEMLRFIQTGYNIVLAKEGKSEKLTEALEKGRKSIKLGKKTLEETRFEFYPDGRLLTRENTGILQGTFRFSENLDSLISSSGSKETFFKVEKLTTNEYIILRSMELPNDEIMPVRLRYLRVD